MPKKIWIPLLILFVLYFAVSIFPTISFFTFVADKSRHETPERNWLDNRIPYSSISTETLYAPSFVEALQKRVRVLVDSLTSEYSVAHNLPYGLGPYELKEFRQPSIDDSSQTLVLLLLDMRLDCSCDERKDSFWHLQYVIDPNTFSIQVVTDAIRPWRTYIPQYRIALDESQSSPSA